MARKPIPIPERPDAPRSNVGIRDLSEQLAACAAAKDPRASVLAALKAALTDGLAQARQLFDNGRTDGLETARLIAAVHDIVVGALWDYATGFEIRASNPTESERVALCAVGGYGRAEMAPHSDLDLLFLTNDKKVSAHVERLTEYVLYMLWDLGLTVGHSVRTADQSVKLAKDDQTILTALLDLRFLRGDEDLATELHTRIRRDLTKGSGRPYIAGKLEERDARHAREGNSRYVIEPNIKEGKGGLRDLHVLYWIGRFLDKNGVINDPQDAAGYVEMGLFDQQAADRFQRAADFLWRARHNLHWSTGRAAETLSFDRQVELCRLMGHASGPVEVAVERFMREYFTNAKEVGALTRIACAKLEAQRAIKIPNLYALLPGRRKDLRNPDLKLNTGRLDFRDPLTIRDDPSIILQIFETAGRRNLDIHPDALQAIDFRRNLIDADFRRDPENAAIFTRMLHTAKAPYATLKLMNEAGVLGRYLIEFGGIVARTQFNMHHAYTVDEHTLRLVSEADDLLDARNEDMPVVNDVAAQLTKQERLILMLTCLLHDTGKGHGDQCVEGAQLGRRACRRLGQPREVTEAVAWLIRSHLEMSETAQRRDISDPETVAEFARLVGSPARLRLLYVLTVCDIRSVGPGIWNDWKATLLRGLYQAALAYLDGREELKDIAQASTLEEQLIERLPGDMGARVAPVLERFGPSYFNQFDMTQLLLHTRFIDSVVEAGLEHGVQTRVDRKQDATELWVMTHDRPGLFADLARVIASCGAMVAGARLHTGPEVEGRDGATVRQVFNVFYLHNSDGHAFGADSGHARDLLTRRATAVLVDGKADMTIPDPIRSRRSEAIPVKSKIKFSDSARGDTTIIEVEGRDRPGLLWALAQTLYEHDLSVLSAHVEGVGERAVDCFYVRKIGEDGQLDEALRKRVRAALKTALAGPIDKVAA